MIKILSNLGIEGNFPNLIKGTFKKTTVSITLHGESLNAYSLGSGTREDVHFHLSFSTLYCKS